MRGPEIELGFVAAAGALEGEAWFEGVEDGFDVCAV